MFRQKQKKNLMNFAAGQLVHRNLVHYHELHMLQQSPYLLYSDGKGNIFEDKSLYAAGRAAGMLFLLQKKNGLNYLMADICMNCREAEVLALM